MVSFLEHSVARSYNEKHLYTAPQTVSPKRLPQTTLADYLTFFPSTDYLLTKYIYLNVHVYQ